MAPDRGFERLCLGTTPVVCMLCSRCCRERRCSAGCCSRAAVVAGRDAGRRLVTRTGLFWFLETITPFNCLQVWR